MPSDKVCLKRVDFTYMSIMSLCCYLGLKEKVHINSLNQGLKFQTGVLAGQMHINSLNVRLNFKPWFENFKPRFKTFKPRFERKSAH